MTRSITRTYRFEKHRIFEINDQWITRSSVALAREIGDNEARLLLQLEYLIATSHNERDGRLWTYQSLSDLETMFPWSKPTIQRAIKSLEKQNLITVTGKYNRKKYDRTNWFAINFEGAARLKSIKIATDQNETRSFQNETWFDQNETATDKNETTIPKRSTERSTKSSTNTLRATARGEIDDDDQVTKTLAKDRGSEDREVRRVEICSASQDLEDRLFAIINDRRLSKNDRDALERLRKNHDADQVIDCAHWMIENLDRVPLTPTTIERYLPTYLAKAKAGTLNRNRYETKEERKVRIYEERDYEEITKDACAEFIAFQEKMQGWKEPHCERVEKSAEEKRQEHLRYLERCKENVEAMRRD
jgi:predicted transcriptional regulator/DNA-binding PadR family transcriptional regulator